MYTDLEHALIRRLWRLVGNERWPSRRRIRANERRWLVEFLVDNFQR